MKSICCTVALLLVLVTAAAVYQLVFVGKTVHSDDGRSAILLSPGERDLVLAEMRTFLQSVQRITQALTTEDMAEAAKAAREVGAAAADGVPVSLMAKLPIGFKTLGLSTHRAFDQLALDAEQLGDPAHTLSQLAALQTNCVGCHAGFRIQTEQ